MSSPARDIDQPKSFVTEWIIAVFLILGFVLALLIFPPLYDAPTHEASSGILFIGRFHPILLHLPVGALGLLCFFELICSTRRGEEKYGAAALLILLVGAAGAVLAVLAGIMLSREGGYEGGNFSLHQTMGILGTAGVLLALVVRISAMGRNSMELLTGYRALFFLSFGVMGLGAHFGGNMSHGNKFLIQHAPEPIKTQMIAMEKWLLGFVEKPKSEPESEVIVEPKSDPKPEPKADPQVAPAPATEGNPAPADGDKLVFQHVILPILEAKCNKCHNEEKSKGDLRMDTYELTLQGGENGKNIVAGKPEESLTITRIMLPIDDDEGEHMPPEGKDQLTPEEIALLKWWIKQGASNTEKVGDAHFPPELQATVDGILKG